MKGLSLHPFCKGVDVAPARLRANLAPQDRTAVIAAESVLYRVVRGPLSMEDVQIMRDDVNRLELPSHLDAIGNRLSPASSL